MVLPPSFKNVENTNDDNEDFFEAIRMESKVMFIDDSEFSRELFLSTFSNVGYKHLITCHNGREALNMMKEKVPDILILDLMMPEIDGFEFCQIVRSHKEWDDIPILVQSGTTNPKDVARIFRDGATDFVNKPLHANELLSRTKVHLQNKLLIRDLKEYQNRVVEELTSAQEMQRSILPSKDGLDEIRDNYHIDIAGHFQPSSEIGGDFWGTFEVSPNKLGFYSVDFSGHGVTAAINVFRFHALINNSNVNMASPVEFLEVLNNQLKQMLNTGQFATMFYAVLDIDEKCLKYASAGAPQPIVTKRKNGNEIQFLESRGLPLGAILNAKYIEHEIEFEEGDTILLFSDALIESEDLKGDFITEEQVANFLSYCDETMTSDEIMQELVEYCKAHVGSVDIKDDLTMHVYRLKSRNDS